MSGLLRVLRDLALLIARIALGALLVFRGWRRWTSDGGMQAQVDYLRQFNTPIPDVLAWGGTLLEIIGGVFLIFGLLTPLVALAILVQQVMVISWTKWFRGPWAENGGYEYNVIQGVLALLLTVFGAGRLGIDQLFRRNKDTNDPLLDDDFGTSRGGATRSDAGPA